MNKKIRSRIEGIGKKDLMIRNTIRLFKQDYWYILDLSFSLLIGSITIHICDQDIIISNMNEQKFLIKIESANIDNFLIIKIPDGASVIIETLKIYTLGLVDYGINKIEGVGGTLRKDSSGNEYIENENMNFSTFQDRKNIITLLWNGITLEEENYDGQANQSNLGKTYFRIFSPPLEVNERKLLLRWLQQTH